MSNADVQYRDNICHDLSNADVQFVRCCAPPCSEHAHPQHTTKAFPTLSLAYMLQQQPLAGRMNPIVATNTKLCRQTQSLLPRSLGSSKVSFSVRDPAKKMTSWASFLSRGAVREMHQFATGISV